MIRLQPEKKRAMWTGAHSMWSRMTVTGEKGRGARQVPDRERWTGGRRRVQRKSDLDVRGRVQSVF